MTQPTTETRQRAYDNLYAELTRGVAHAQVRHHLIEEYRAAVLREAADAVLDIIGTEARLPQTISGVYRAADHLRRMADEETSR